MAVDEELRRTRRRRTRQRRTRWWRRWRRWWRGWGSPSPSTSNRIARTRRTVGTHVYFMKRSRTIKHIILRRRCRRSSPRRNVLVEGRSVPKHTSILVTCAVFQPTMSRLNAEAKLNIHPILVTCANALKWYTNTV